MALKNAFGDLNLESTQVDVLSRLLSLDGTFDQDFSRILEKRFKDTEEVRYDIPTDNLLSNGNIYIGVAPDPSLTSDLIWKVVRVYFDANALPFRARYRENVAWDDRQLGW